MPSTIAYQQRPPGSQLHVRTWINKHSSPRREYYFRLFLSVSTQYLPHMGRDLAPGRKPDVVVAAGLGGNCLERPGACWPPVDVGMGGDVEHHGFAFVLAHSRESRVE